MKPGFIIGIDIGGSKIRGVLWDGRRVLASSELPTPRGPSAFRQGIGALARRLSRRARGGIIGIGIGAAGVIRGIRIVRSRNIPYLKNFDLRTVVPAGRLLVDNDARAFARAEAGFGAGRGARRVLIFTIGTGIGRAYAERGRVRVMKQLEHAELWEREYQRIRDRGDTRALAAFLGQRLAAIARRYKPGTIVLGGGVLGRRGLIQRLKAEFLAGGVKAKVRRGRLGWNAGAIGAALLFS